MDRVPFGNIHKAIGLVAHFSAALGIENNRLRGRLGRQGCGVSCRRILGLQFTKQKAAVGSAGGSVGSRHKIITTFHENCGLRQTALRHARRAWRAERCFVIPLYKASSPLIGAFYERGKKTAYCIKPGQENCAGPPRQFLQCCVKRVPLRCADNGLTIRLSERIRFVQSISYFSSIALSVWLFVCRSRCSSAAAGANGRSQHKTLSIEKMQCDRCLCAEENKPKKEQHPAGCCSWRRRWDSNPRGIAAKLISSHLECGSGKIR